MGKPKPFQRPGIELSDGTKKDWKEVSVFSVEIGDMVRDLGMVTDKWDSPGGLTLVFRSGNQYTFDEGDKVFAFVRV